MQNQTPRHTMLPQNVMRQDSIQQSSAQQSLMPRGAMQQRLTQQSSAAQQGSIQQRLTQQSSTQQGSMQQNTTQQNAIETRVSFLRRLRCWAYLLYRYIFRVAPLPHVTGGASAYISFELFYRGVIIVSEGAFVMGALFVVPAAGWFCLAFLCCLDGYSRYREYLRVRRILLHRGFSSRLLRPVATSRCQRDAAAQAVRDAGYGQRAREYFRSLGYRWYHLLPDRVVDNPLRFFDVQFLRITFLPGKR